MLEKFKSADVRLVRSRIKARKEDIGLIHGVVNFHFFNLLDELFSVRYVS